VADNDTAPRLLRNPTDGNRYAAMTSALTRIVGVYQSVGARTVMNNAMDRDALGFYHAVQVA
jgi:hypothetical protein